MAIFQSEVRLSSLKRTFWKQTRDSLASEKGLQLMKVITRPSIDICLDTEQFVLLHGCVYNDKSLSLQSVIKQEIPKYQASQNPTYQIDSLRREINKKLFAKADSLLVENVPCPRIKLPNSQTLILDGVETGG